MTNWTLRFFTPKIAPNPVLAREISKRTFYLLKVLMEGFGGIGGYMMQRYFAAKSDRNSLANSFVPYGNYVCDETLG